MRKKLLMAGVLFLLIFQACSSNEDLSTGQNSSTKTIQKNVLRTARSDSGTLSDYVSTQLSIQSEIKNLLDNEKDADFSLIQSGIDRVKTVEELESLYNSAKIGRSRELISLYEKMNDNSLAFRESNADFYSKYTEEERTRMLTNEVDLQLNYKETTDTADRRRNCQSAFVTAGNRCMRNYAIEIGGSVLVGVFTGGVGGVIAGGMATTHMIVCNSDAETDYRSCVRSGGIR
ncbi:hypothetical protein PFY10_09935 [Chryseobacterium daecheongense]|nr:hypothetical protein PFY10_09935 [Chryseobacterium daecheongense]